MSNTLSEYDVSKEISNNIKNLIYRKLAQLSEQINSSLIFLFWQIGKELNQANVKVCERSANELCKKMTERFGRLFGRTNLSLMQALADQFPDVVILHKVSVILNCKDLRLLLKMDEPEKRNFYFKQIRQQINSKQSKATGSQKEDLFKEINRAFQENRKRYSSGFSVFNTSIKNLLLLDLSENSPLSDEEKGNGQNGIFDKVNQIVHSFIRQQNTFFHTQFNLLRWEIGKILLKEMLEKGYQGKISEISFKKSADLSRTYGKCFDATQMSVMAMFAGKVLTDDAATIISSALDWTQIEILTSNNYDPEQFFFYAKLAISEKPDDQKLTHIVRGKRYQHFLESGGRAITEPEFVENFTLSDNVRIQKKRNSD